MSDSRDPLTEHQMLRYLAGRPALAPFHFELEKREAPTGDAGYGGVLRARSQERGLERRFAFACRTEWRLRALSQMVESLRKAPKPLLPLVVFPYLSQEQLEELRALRVSGLDLCGNGLLYDPPGLFVLHTGAKKLFKTVFRTPSIYDSRNVGSLVARAFLTRPAYPTGQAVLDACRLRAMPLAGKPPPLVLPTISRTLSQLADDLVVVRKQREVRLRDPERLLSNLARHFRLIAPPEKDRFFGKTSLSAEEVWARLKQLRPSVRAVVTGRGSAGHYTGLAGPDRLQLHVSDIQRVAEELGARQTRAFPNLELIETNEEAPFFEAREQSGVVWASPVHTFLEMSEGTPREIDAAQELRARLLRDVQLLVAKPAAIFP